MKVAGGGGTATTPSPERAQRVTVRWLPASLPMSAGGEYGESALPLATLASENQRVGGYRAGLPLLVYFYSARNDEKLLDFEGRVFYDERVGFSSRFFNCLRISLDEIRDAGVRKSYGGEEPALFVLDREGKQLKRLDGWRTESVELFKGMESAFKETTGKALAGLVEKEARILQNLDRIHWEVEDLKESIKDTETHLASHDCDRGRRELAESQADMAKLAAEKAKVLDEEAKLLEPVSPKPPEAPKGL